MKKYEVAVIGQDEKDIVEAMDCFTDDAGYLVFVNDGKTSKSYVTVAIYAHNTWLSVKAVK